jgi:hypothetical protein
MNGKLKPFLRPREFHTALGGCVGLAEIYARLRSGEIRSIRVGKSKRFLVPAAEIEEWPRRAVSGGGL